MTVSATAAAKRLCVRSGWRLSNLEVQKLLYIAHMLHLGRTGEPLIDGHFEAWDYGPVEPRLYHELKMFGADPVFNVFAGVRDLPDDSPEAMSLDQTQRMLADATPGRLVAITHRDDGAWARHYDSARRRVVIPNRDIAAEYLDRTNASRRRREQRP